MRIFALSDLHVDYEANLKWVHNLSRCDLVDDLLIMAGDISHHRSRIDACLTALTRRFKQVLFVPGNHDLWVLRDPPGVDSLMKFEAVMQTAGDCGATTTSLRFGNRLIVPLLGWYDYSFGRPVAEIRHLWTDFRACRWPAGFDEAAITDYFTRLNVIPPARGINRADVTGKTDTANGTGLSGMADTTGTAGMTGTVGETGLPGPATRPEPGALTDLDSLAHDAGAHTPSRITVSHFLPRADLVPAGVPEHFRILTPVLGSTRLEEQLRRIRPDIHIYGHSHINRDVMLEGIRYINNAFGYPQETRIAGKQLLCIDAF
ncbi:MAG: metallophosphoesterase [Lautropia sp.]|nr:metallophosphoesterase [Lautropia sp.]